MSGKSSPDPAELCSRCQAIQLRLLPDPEETRPDSNLKQQGFKHSTAGELLQSSLSCPLCALIRASFLRVGCHHTPAKMVDERLSDSPDAWILLRAKRGAEGRDAHRGAGLTSIEPVLDTPNNSLTGRICLYAPKGSPALRCGDVLPRPILTELSPLKPSTLVLGWLKACLTSHPYCCRRLEGGLAAAEDPNMDIKLWADAPSRLMQISLRKEKDLTRRTWLVSTAELKLATVPKYVTLSHCWGPADKRPLRTTKDNLRFHEQSIPWSHLPATFRDVINLCAHLGIQYVWIDSLCIVQDSLSDWESEARKMATVYENAHFTIAASAAPDSTAGLFKSREALHMVPIPYSGGQAGPRRPVYGYVEPNVAEALKTSPLSRRAWVFQEYFLSRRTVHFTKHGLVWTCKGKDGSADSRSRYSMTEFGELLFQPIPETKRNEVVSSYSQRELTFKEDRLVAIEGLKDLFRAKQRDKVYRHGLWVQDMPRDLLWYSDERLTRDVPAATGIPSWSWAASMGAIKFQEAVFGDVENTCELIDYSTDREKYLIIRSRVRQADAIRGPLQCQAFCYEDLVDMDFDGRLHDDYKAGNIKASPTFLLLAGEERVGWVVFDNFRAPKGPIFCLSLVRQKMGEWHANSSESHFLWVLVLGRNKWGVAGQSDNTFERMGWGIVLVPSWLEGQPPTDVILK